MNNLYNGIRPILRKTFLDFAGRFKTPSHGIHILNGHTICTKHSDGINEFRRQLNDLSKYVKFINFEEAVKLIHSKKSVDYPMVAFSWDDGFAEHYTHIAPIIEDYGINAAFFINPNFVDADDKYIAEFTEKVVRTPNRTPMRWWQIEDLDGRGHIIGAHTMDHFMIRNSDNDNELKHQIVDCKRVIERHLNKTCDYFAFPYGRIEQADEKSIALACETYKYVFSQSDYKHYYSFKGRVINRRHFEPFWPLSHVKYFLSCRKK